MSISPFYILCYTTISARWPDDKADSVIDCIEIVDKLRVFEERCDYEDE